MMFSRLVWLSFCVGWVMLVCPPSRADMLPIFGPRQFVRGTGVPQTFNATFQNCETTAQYKLVVRNGNPDGSNRVSSASILLNGKEIVSSKDFNQQVAKIEKPVSVLPTNQLQVTLNSQPQSVLTISVECTANCLDVQFQFPLPGTAAAGILLVQGAVRGSGDVGVVVNGMRAEVQGQNFASILTAFEETSLLTATATNSCGQSARDSIPVSFHPSPQPVSVSASPQSGLAPLAVELRSTVIIERPVESISWDFEGDGIPDVSGSTLAETTTTYQTPGLYIPTVTVRDATGNTFSSFVVINVSSEQALTEQMIRRWNSFREALGGGDVQQALNLIDPEKLTVYENIFLAAGSDLPSLAQSLSGDLQLQVVTGPWAFFKLLNSAGSPGDERAVTFRLD